MLEPEDEGTMMLRNLSNYLPVERVQGARTPVSSAMPLSETEI
jgi:hypothetical protein